MRLPQPQRATIRTTTRLFADWTETQHRTSLTICLITSPTLAVGSKAVATRFLGALSAVDQSLKWTVDSARCYLRAHPNVNRFGEIATPVMSDSIRTVTEMYFQQ